MIKNLTTIVLAWLTVFGCVVVGRAQDSKIDWPRYQDMAVDLMQQYLRVNTSNPPGNELEAAKFLKKVFDQHGIENEIFEFKPGRANIIARIKGNGSKRPILLLRSEERRVGKEWRSRWWLELGRKSEDEM